MKKIILAVVLLASQAKAEIVCTAQTDMGQATIQISDSTIKVSGASLDTPVVYSQLNAQYDGHMTEIITGPGIAVSYQDWYGCIHNATITTNFRSGDGLFQTVTVSQCSGGSTPDEICHVPGAQR